MAHTDTIVKQERWTPGVDTTMRGVGESLDFAVECVRAARPSALVLCTVDEANWCWTVSAYERGTLVERFPTEPSDVDALRRALAAIRARS